MAAWTQKLYVVNDKRDGIENTGTGGELKDDELLGVVIHYNPICYASKRLELSTTNFELEDWQILVKLRDDTGYAGWTRNTEGWDTLEEHKDPSRCAGVIIESGKITKIDLSNSNLAGALPESIGQLSSLQILNCYRCKLTVLPESIGKLSCREYLDCLGCELTSHPRTMSKLQALQKLHVGNNQLQYSDVEFIIESFPQLTTLSISKPGLTALPESISNLQNLTELYAQANDLRALPDSIGQLSSLQRLNCTQCKLTALPDSIGQLSSLRMLHCGGNAITALPESIGQLSNLAELQLGEQKRWIGTLAAPHAAHFSLYYFGEEDPEVVDENWEFTLSALPDSIGNFENLTYLDVQHNALQDAEKQRVRAALPDCGLRGPAGMSAAEAEHNGIQLGIRF
jgi:hypothetical protein